MPLTVIFGVILVFWRMMVVWMEIVVHGAVVLVFVWLVMLLVRFVGRFEDGLVGQSVFLGLFEGLLCVEGWNSQIVFEFA